MTRLREARGEVRELIRERLEPGARPDDVFMLPSALLRFYESRGFEPAWSHSGDVGTQSHALLEALERAHLDGLRPADYQLAAVQALLARSRRYEAPQDIRIRELAELDLLLTDAFFSYGGHLLVGRLDPATLTALPPEDTEDIDLVDWLEEALRSDRIEESLAALIQDAEPGYLRLRSALAEYRRIASGGGWPALPGGEELRRGDEGPDVAVLRRRLIVSGDHAAVDEPALHFDAELERAVKRFQRRHGLPTEGAVDSATRRALDVPAEWRTRQIELNLERWRWLPRRLADRHLTVNSAAFLAEIRDGGRQVLSLRVIVGTHAMPTPLFSDTISYLVFNPTWNVPRDIMQNEILPLAAADPDYLRREAYRIIGPGGVEIDPAAIDWAGLDVASFPYRIQQAPGPRNALGRVKFMFPNQHAVYLHDTRDRALFDQPLRNLSHGCIRVEGAIELAEYLLGSADGWRPERIRDVLASGEETTVVLPEPVPIYLQYWTAWADSENRLHFREDIYGRDVPLDRRLQE